MVTLGLQTRPRLRLSRFPILRTRLLLLYVQLYVSSCMGFSLPDTQHNLPPLHSPQAIDELGPHHLRAYVRGYHPNLQAPGDRNECIKLVLTGIGAYGHVRE